MKVRNIFSIVTNFIGLNFCELKAPIVTIIGFQIFMQIFNILAIFYVPYFHSKYSWYSGHGVYSILQIYQSILPYAIQNFVILNSFMKRNQQKYLSQKLKPKFTQKLEKCEKGFLIRVTIIILIRIAKFSWGHNKNNAIFNSHTAFPELIYSSNDLMFVYYVELLIEYLDHINHKIQMIRTQNDLKIIKGEILEAFQLKRKILERYSVDIFITIVFHFLLMIVAFYWMIMRAIFGRLRKFFEFATFLHFIEPIFVFWIVFSRCEKFNQKVSNVSISSSLAKFYFFYSSRKLNSIFT